MTDMSLLDRLKPRPTDGLTRDAIETRRSAIIDIGSNSIRLVVYDGPRRMPFVLFNEKVMAGLGAALDKSGRLEGRAMERGIAALERFAQLCAAMQVEDVRCVATAAVRDAANGQEFLDRAAEVGLHVRLLSGQEEARASAHGLISGMPDANGIMGDLGGGSLELVRVRQGKMGSAISLPLGVLRIAEVKKEGKDALVRRIASLLEAPGAPMFEQGLPFYMIGGSWRALARLDMRLTRYPLPIIHHYEMSIGRIARLQAWLARADKAQLKAMQLSGTRLPTMPDAAEVLAHITRRLGSSSLVVSAYGLREGLLFEALPEDVAQEDPLLAAARTEGNAQGRFMGHGDKIGRWIAPLFADDSPQWARIRLAACLLADVSWRANPEFRAERGMEVALHSNWVGLNAQERAVLAQALHASFGGNAGLVPALQKLAEPTLLTRAVQWGLAIRLCQRLSGGAEGPLAGSSLTVRDGMIVLSLSERYAGLAGETVDRRLRQLGQAMGMSFLLEAGAN